MVRLINKNNVGALANVAYCIMKVQECFTYIKELEAPKVTPCVYALWHENEFCIHGIPDRKNLNVLISTSLDGEIIAQVCEKWGFRVRRGSANRKGAVSSTLKMLDELKNGKNVAIMIDGPRGPLHKVKRGAVKLSQEADVPIIPVHWYSEDITFCHFPSWDKMSSPVGPCRLLNIYGEPIYPKGKSEDEIADEVKKSLLELEKIAPEKYKEARRLDLWKRKK